MKQRVLVLLVLGLVAAACSGEDSEGVASLAAAEDPAQVASDVQNADQDDDASVDQEQAMLDFAACMRDNGVEIEDPTVDADGNVQFGGLRGATDVGEVDREARRAAMQVCGENLEGFALGRRGGDLDPTEMQDTLVEYAACIRDNGYDMPDPDFSNAGPGAEEPGQGGGGPFGAIDIDDPDFVAARQACGDVLGGLRAPGGGARAGGSGG